WLAARGRMAEADAVLTALERRIEARTAGPLPPPTVAAQTATAEPGRVEAARALLPSLWRPKTRRTTASVWLAWGMQTFVAYGFTTWVPSLLVADGFTLTRSLVYSAVIMAGLVPGAVVAALLSDRLPR